MSELRKALSFTDELFLLFYQYTILGSGAEDAHQMYFRDSVVGEATIIEPEISPTPPQIFTGSKSAKLGLIFDTTRL